MLAWNSVASVFLVCNVFNMLYEKARVITIYIFYNTPTDQWLLGVDEESSEAYIKLSALLKVTYS